MNVYNNRISLYSNTACLSPSKQQNNHISQAPLGKRRRIGQMVPGNMKQEQYKNYNVIIPYIDPCSSFIGLYLYYDMLCYL